MDDVPSRILATIAEQRGVEPSDLSVPLYEAVDPDALDALLSNGGVSVTFAYDGTLVSVDGDGEVAVTPEE